MELELNDICLCDVRLFTDTRTKGIGFLVICTKEDIESGTYNVDPFSPMSIDWDNVMQYYDGTEFLQTRYGLFTNKTYIVSDKEFYRISNLFIDKHKDEKIVVDINPDQVIKYEVPPRKKLHKKYKY